MSRLCPAHNVCVCNELQLNLIGTILFVKSNTQWSSPNPRVSSGQCLGLPPRF